MVSTFYLSQASPHILKSIFNGIPLLTFQIYLPACLDPSNPNLYILISVCAINFLGIVWNIDTSSVKTNSSLSQPHNLCFLSIQMSPQKNPDHVKYHIHIHKFNWNTKVTTCKVVNFKIVRHTHNSTHKCKYIRHKKTVTFY